MADFTDDLWDRLMTAEGRVFTNRASDRGGATSHGLTLRFLLGLSDADGDGFRDGDVDHDGDVDVQDVRSIDDPTARRIYLRHVWRALKLEEISDQVVAERLFDLAVNAGPGQMALLAQRAARACLVPVVEDGKWGPGTRAAVNACRGETLLCVLRAEHAAFYRLLIALNPTDPTVQKNARGWITRAYRA